MKAIIFDLFGTLVYIEKETDPYLKAYKEYFSGILTYDEFRREAMARDFNSISSFGKSKNLSEQDLQLFDVEVEQEVESIKMYEEVEEVLSHFSQHTDLYVLSNIASQYIRGYNNLGFDKWIKKPYFSSKIGYIKPEQEVFEYVINDIGVNKEEVLMVGDSYTSDYQGAKEFGLKSVWLNREGKEHKGSISNLRELKSWIESGH